MRARPGDLVVKRIDGRPSLCLVLSARDVRQIGRAHAVDVLLLTSTEQCRVFESDLDAVQSVKEAQQRRER